MLENIITWYLQVKRGGFRALLGFWESSIANSLGGQGLAQPPLLHLCIDTELLTGTGWAVLCPAAASGDWIRGLTARLGGAPGLHGYLPGCFFFIGGFCWLFAGSGGIISLLQWPQMVFSHILRWGSRLGRINLFNGGSAAEATCWGFWPSFSGCRRVYLSPDLRAVAWM